MLDTEITLLQEEVSEKINFKEYCVLSEAFINLHAKDHVKKRAHAKEVFDLLQNSYASQGGIKGSGFNSPEDMVDKIPMWKISKKAGKIVAVSLYKDANGRKMVVMGSDGTDKGKQEVSNMLTSDLKMRRANMEISGKALSFLKRLTNVQPHAASFDAATAYHNARGDVIHRPLDTDPEVIKHPEFKNHFYTRTIGGHPHTKLMIGPNLSRLNEVFKGQVFEETILDEATDEEKNDPYYVDDSKFKHLVYTGPKRTTPEEWENGKDSELKQGFHKLNNNWTLDAQVHGPSQAKDRRPGWKQKHWDKFLQDTHDALTDKTKHITNEKSIPSLGKEEEILVYSQGRKQGIVYNVTPKIPKRPLDGGDTRIVTVLPYGQSAVKDGKSLKKTRRIVIENVEYTEGENLIVIA